MHVHFCNTPLQHTTATHSNCCNTQQLLQHTATAATHSHCCHTQPLLQHTAQHGVAERTVQSICSNIDNTVQSAATHCNVLRGPQQTANQRGWCRAYSGTATIQCNILQHTATAATNHNTLQQTAYQRGWCRAYSRTSIASLRRLCTEKERGRARWR